MKNKKGGSNMPGNVMGTEGGRMARGVIRWFCHEDLTFISGMVLYWWVVEMFPGAVDIRHTL